ncbi:L,D-transpeptidase family protein [Streptomyces sp. RK62]|uniref:L,D-transpeptidase family protein n=1 Tax=Streptomyces sp. RK62 TaxID=2824893 RepID=UPI0027E27766|nr:L,D-transpeptidase family protein [Streptomyces sp. RK62]
MQALPRQVLITAAAFSALAMTSACAGQDDQQTPAAGSVEVSRSPEEAPTRTASPSASGSSSTGPSASASGRVSASPSASASASDSATGETAGGASGSPATAAAPAPAAPDFPVPVETGDATQLITVEAGGSYATVTAWAKRSSGWKAQFSTSAARVGSNGVTDGATRRQGTYTTPTGTYTITEGFGNEAGGTAMPYHRVTNDDWWVEDPESKFYNSMHGEAGADFPLTESGDLGSEHLVNYPVQYAKALVINFNRWPATPGRGAGIFLHVNGSGATAGCVSVPRATMDRIMSWMTPAAHPRIAIG